MNMKKWRVTMNDEFESWAEEMSPTIGKLAGAMAKAQGEIAGAAKGAENPFFISSARDCRGPFLMS